MSTPSLAELIFNQQKLLEEVQQKLSQSLETSQKPQNIQILIGMQRDLAFSLRQLYCIHQRQELHNLKLKGRRLNVKSLPSLDAN